MKIEIKYHPGEMLNNWPISVAKTPAEIALRQEYREIERAKKQHEPAIKRFLKDGLKKLTFANTTYIPNVIDDDVDAWRDYQYMKEEGSVFERFGYEPDHEGY